MSYVAHIQTNGSSNLDCFYHPKWIVTECPQRNCNPKLRKCATARLCRWNFSERFCEGCWWCMEFVRQARQQSVPARAIYRESSCRYEDCNCLPLLTLCLIGFALTIKKRELFNENLLNPKALVNR